MLIRLFQLTARSSVAECLVHPFPGLFASFSFSSPAKRPARSTWRSFDWCEQRGLRLGAIRPTTVAAYIEQLGAAMAKPSVKQHLAAIRQLFDYLVTGGILQSNPAGAVRGPKYVVKRGKTPVLSADQARQLMDSIDVTELSGLRDRALIASWFTASPA